MYSVRKPGPRTKKYHDELDKLVDAGYAAEVIQRMHAPHPRTGERAILELEAMEMALDMYAERETEESELRNRRKFLNNLRDMSPDELQKDYDDWVGLPRLR